MLLNWSSRKVSGRNVARDLDLHPNLVHQWRRMFMTEGDGAFVGTENIISTQSEPLFVNRLMFNNLSRRQIISESVKQLVILIDCMNGCHRGFEQYPTEDKDHDGESDLPCQRRLWTPPDQGQRQRTYRADCDDDKGFPEIPSDLFLCKAWRNGGLQKFTAVFALYRVVLNIIRTEGTLFHSHLSWQEHLLISPPR